ncbi:hypothetical protein NKR23_g10668 [Pleurostoma richardsiae]|uniref:Chromo domain-containing protein n=1 Tax=Pleurostoma richardsiae TaxID=41990 RepID=A0AA38RJG1_9PEZI|nr:hypothetical protein NKR23_g10668 [Pleurostoma richardsiae]
MAGTFEQMGAGDQTPDDFDDAISVTSTVEGSHDPDEEYEVEGIRDEVVDENGATYFLVEWTGFNLDQCTWEPETNLGPDIRQMMWETKKATMSPEERARERQEVEDAQQRVLQEKLERHKRRNAARKRRGLPLTEPFEEEEVLPPPTVVDVDSGKESSDEAMEDNAMPSEPSQSLASTPKVSGKQRIFKGIPPPTETPVTKTVPRRSSDMTTTAGMTPKKPVVKKTSQNSLSRSSLASTVDDRSSQRNEPKSVTGYQGTARKTAPGSTGSTSATKLTGPPNTARATLAVKFSTKPLKAKKSGQVANHGLDPGITNVFAGEDPRRKSHFFGL